MVNEILTMNGTFTARQWEIITHRLEAPDAIVDVMTDDNPDLDVASLKDDIDLLEFCGATRTEFNEQEHAIIRECCAGSTFFAGIEDAVAGYEITYAQAKKYRRAANWLERLLDVTIPRA